MAFLLYKYLKKRRGERQAAAATTTDDSHLVPEIGTGQEQKPMTLESLDGGGVGTNTRLTAEENARIKAEAKRKSIYRWKIMLGLLLPSFLAAVDVTIVAPAVPIISSHFNRLSGAFNWIVAAYTLTNTTFVPLSGQIADIYGRHFALQFHMLKILIGSILCAASVSWTMLLVGRALQGIGAAGVMNLTRIILSDNMSLADNSRNNTIFSLINGVSYAVGPVIGGYLASASWRYCFVLPIPIAFLAMVLIFFLMRKELVKGRVSAAPGESRKTGYITGLATFDWPGMIFFIFGVGLIILAVMWGGTQYAWSSAGTVAPLVIGGILCIAFFLHEYLLGPDRFMTRIFKNQVAMIPSTLFRRKDTSLLMIINFATGVSLVSAFYFISYYWQLAEGYSASDAGIQLLYYTPGLGVGVYSAMFLCNVWPRQTYYTMVVGSIIECVGIALLTWAVSIRGKALVNGMLALSGAGTGLRFMPVVLHAAGIWPSRITAIQSLMSFTIPFGQTIGISIMGAVFTNKFDQGLRSISASGADSNLTSNGPPNLNDLDGLPPALKSSVESAAAKAVMWAFIAILPFMGISVVASCFLGNVWLGKDAQPGKKGKAATEEEKGRVLYGSYLMAALAGSVQGNTEVVEKPGLQRAEGQAERETARPWV